jgi:hypothetical protein
VPPQGNDFRSNFILYLNPHNSEKISHILNDCFQIAKIPYYSINPMDTIFDCGLLELREEILQGMENRIDQYIAENQQLFAKISDLVL